MMEKRLFIAIGLSLAVVWLWSSMAPKPEVIKKFKKDSELTDINGLMNIKADSRNFLPEKEKLNETQWVAENIDVIDSDKLIGEFSNIGGIIKRATIKEYGASLPITGIAGLSGYDDVVFEIKYKDANEIVYVYNSDDIRIEKRFVLKGGDYIIESEIKVTNVGKSSKLIGGAIKSYNIEMSSLDKNSDGFESNNHDRALNEYVVYAQDEVYRKAGASKFSLKERREESKKVLWSGFRNRYYCALIKPEYETDGYIVDPDGTSKLSVSTKIQNNVLKPQEQKNFDSIIFIGPEKTSLLKKYNMGFEQIKRYYKFGLFDGIAKFIDGAMNLMYKVIPNWGVCIILISIVIYFSMYPLTIRSMLSMKRMQALQPMIAKIKEKHKSDPQKMNKEMMELYKEYKINPLGGCLPMLLQMPVFIGLYQVLWRSVSFNGARFLWIKDLSRPDRLFMFPFKMPFVGNEFNVLPVLMIIIMFIQQKLSSKNMVVTDQAQITQQKMMTTIMPVFLGVIFYKFASGLTLYFTMFYLFSTFTQWKMSKLKKDL